MARPSANQTDNARERLPKADLDRDGLRETWSLATYVRPYRGRFFFGLGALFSSALLGLLFPLLAGGLIDAAMHGGRATLPFVGSLTLNQIALTLAVSILLQATGSFNSALSFHRVGQSALADLRAAAYGRLLALPMTFFGQRRVGELASRVSTDIAQIEGALIDSLPQLCRQAVFLSGGLVLIAVTSLPLTAVMLGTLPLLIAAAVFFGRRLRRFSRDTQDRLADSQTIVEETLQAIASVKSFANEAFELNRYAKANGATLAAALRAARWRAVFVAFFIAALFGGILIVLWYGALQLQAGALTGGELTRFVLYTTFVGGAMAQSAELFSQIQKTVGATQRVREILREPVEDEAAIQTNDPSAAPVERLRGEVTFERVSFHYPARPDAPVLHDVNLAARPGERIALVGPSGAGKSTLTALLLRFYDPETGTLLIDGRDARTYPLQALRNQMALVPQDVLLFGGSIMENIAYGRPGADATAVEAAARQANAHEFIAAFPEGYATLVGDRGIKLSGGQRQRIAIARALLKDPAILILDEATSSLDSESERLVQDALDHLMQGRTTFVVAHRLATIRDVDRIAVIDGGRVVETGTHDELSVRPEGLYRRLSALQFGDTKVVE
ncbi:ABC transporter ATP-binding protein [Synoicihabitans lomoniglobus]|uniref:ABC transporter transmembrane domain-containing protein n=1 Tax=Synoicihabitans lomoniglobus TaxID=2909285 RepID=A0AAE9ZS93_9BACT|nr:ATP-binding cassette domain-containing protein [Opitutaceae bacterium LMO-M01]WED64290.1 ABC transporter transmembrane domain-containing protein [Opitutaceae bacterium LMO-M01]